MIGWLDLCGRNSGDLSVWWGDGSGVFGLDNETGDYDLQLSADLGPSGPIAIGDLDGDEVPDIATVSGTSIKLWRGCRNGARYSIALAPDQLPLTDGKALQIADWNGDGRNDLMATYGVRGVRLFLNQTPERVELPPDLNCNCLVDVADLNAVIGNFGTDALAGDADRSGATDVADLNLVLGNFGLTCE